MDLVLQALSVIETSALMFYNAFSELQSTDEFRSKVACENDVIQLMCNPYSRIAIYGAHYGRTEYESLQCAQPSGVKEESKLINLQLLLSRRKLTFFFNTKHQQQHAQLPSQPRQSWRYVMARESVH